MGLWTFKYLVLIQALFQRVASVVFFQLHTILNVFLVVSRPPIHNHDMITFWHSFLTALMAYYLFTMSFVLFYCLLFSSLFSLCPIIDSHHVLLRMLPWPSQISCFDFSNHTDSDSLGVPGLYHLLTLCIFCLPTDVYPFAGCPTVRIPLVAISWFTFILLHGNPS